MNERTTLEKIAPSVEDAIDRGIVRTWPEQGCRGCGSVGRRQPRPAWNWRAAGRVRLTLKAIQTDPAAAGVGKTESSRLRQPARHGESIPSETMEDGFRSLDDNLLFISRQTVAEMLEKMKIPARVEARYGEPDEEGQRPVHIDIRGNDLAVLIGRRAEILNAMQYIVNLIVSKQVEYWVQIVIDVEGYRARRERQLRQMAQRMADQAVKTGRRQVLEPMAAVERRIVHLELRNHPNVITQSIGEEPSRKVTIVPK